MNRRVTSFRKPFVPACCLFVRQQFRLARSNIAYHSHSVGMIGYHQPVQRARQPHALASQRLNISFKEEADPPGLVPPGHVPPEIT